MASTEDTEGWRLSAPTLGLPEVQEVAGSRVTRVPLNPICPRQRGSFPVGSARAKRPGVTRQVPGMFVAGLFATQRRLAAPNVAASA